MIRCQLPTPDFEGSLAMTSTDGEALLVMFRSTGGANWTRKDYWGTDADLSRWQGVKVNGQGRVVGLSLMSNNLQGPIPKELGALSKLQELLLHDNQLTGSIPSELGKLQALQRLQLWRNELSGEIPTSLGLLGNLQKLLLHDNELSGHIPNQIGALSTLAVLSLGENQITGSIPAQLGGLSALTILSLHRNRLSGHIPKELGALSKLQRLWLHRNELTGPIPAELGALGKLEMLSLSQNHLTGHIPKELGALSKLRSLWLNGNQLAALWDHTQDVRGVGLEEKTNSESGGVPSQLLRLLDVFDRIEMCSDLNLDDNPWTEPPESIVGKGAKDIRGYFEDVHAEPCRIHRNSIKIILVGQEGAGKTSLRQSMKANRPAPTAEWKEESTVFADVEPMELEGASARVYDCAGQVAYTGLLQMFLTPRSVCMLVCNAEAFEGPDDRTGSQEEGDIRKLEELYVCDWLRSISRRVPGNDVILVATKCDLARNPLETGRRIEQACRTWLASWSRDSMHSVRVEDGVCLTSCCSENQASEEGWACDWDWGNKKDVNPSLSLRRRLVNNRDGGGLRGSQMVIPRSWDIALKVLEALEHGRNPVETATQHLAHPGGRDATSKAQPKGGVYRGITVEELSAKWQETVDQLAKRDITVTNAKNALEGALSIREFDGSLVRHETFIFLDVVWLARILKPLLNHKDEETFDGFVKLGDTGDARITLKDSLDIASWGRLKREGILEPRLAQAMWPAGLSEYVLPTLVSLGLTFPLENNPAGGLVVLLRLKSERPARVGEVMDTFCARNTPALSARWKIFLGVPPGAIEKVLTWCCSLGGVQTFWRFGVLVHGGFGDGGDGSRMFAVVSEYSSADNELAVQVYGDISNPAPWAALSYVVSAVRVMLLEFPGLRSKGSLECPQHGDAMPLTTTATRAGDQLVLESAGCPQCSPDTRGQGAAAVELLRMVDIRLHRDVIFDEVNARFGALEGQYFSRLSPNSQDKVLINKIDDLAAAVGRIDRSIQESLMCLKKLQAPDYPYPHLVVVKEVKAQGKKSLLSKVRDVGVKDMTLHFLCPVDMSTVPCGVNGEGYRFRETRGWIKKLSPVLQVAVVTAKVALKATSGLDVDISEFLQAVQEGLVEEVADGTLDEKTLSRVVCGGKEADTGMQSRARASYETLKKFMDKETLHMRKSAHGRDGYVDFREKMQRVSDGKGGLVWVRTENVRKWQDFLSSAAPSR